jgi:hypothetical protein
MTRNGTSVIWGTIAMRKQSICEFEFDLLLDAVRTAIAPAPQADVSLRPLIFSEPLEAANDNHPAWPLIPFPEGWYGAS